MFRVNKKNIFFDLDDEAFFASPNDISLFWKRLRFKKPTKKKEYELRFWYWYKTSTCLIFYGEVYKFYKV